MTSPPRRGLGRVQSLPGIAVAMLMGFVVLAALIVRRYSLARIAVVAQSVAVLAGRYLAQAPYLIPGKLTVADAAAPPSVLRAFLWLTAGGAVLLVPSLVLLFRVFKTESPKAT